MKKSLIAGASALALGMAVIPAAGVFADNITEMTDTINVTVESFCTFDAASHSYTKTMTAGTLETVGTTNMVVTCNQYNGYAVTGDFTVLSANGGSSSIAYSTTEATAGAGKWSATVTPTVNGTANSATNPAATSGAILSNTVAAPAAGDSASIVYKVGTANPQAAGTYTGTATYTLTANS